MTNRRGSNDSPITTTSQGNTNNSACKLIDWFCFILFHQRMYHSWEYVYIQNSTFVSFSISQLLAAISSHQLNPIDGRRHHQHHPSRHSHDVTMTNEDSSLSGTSRSSARSRTRPMPTSYGYWLNTGDNNNHIDANFMRLTYAASCRSRLSRSVERCPRACRGILSSFQLRYNTCVRMGFFLLFVRVCVITCFALIRRIILFQTSFHINE